MRLKHVFLLALGLVMSASAAFAQKSVSGIVKDRHGEPLIGANVYVKGTTISTISGINGEFNISASPDAIVVISFEGYQDLEVAVADLPTANLQLKPEKLIGIAAFYGNDDYYSLTTGSTLIGRDDIETGIETDIHQYLLGKVPGLEVIPDASGKVYYRMRGGDSPTDKISEPLFVIDGMYDLASNMAVEALNPNDIESIRVLKDIAATAQYGERGRNGVVVIKTRQPSDKLLVVDYDGNASFNMLMGESKDKADDDPFDYKNVFGTKQNVAVRGLASVVPYRVALGYNSVGNMIGDENTNLLSGSFWVGPRLLDKHLGIDLNGYFRNSNGAADVNDYNRLSTILKADYSVHSLEDLHVNLSAGYNSDLDSASMIMLDGNLDIHHQFDKKYYIEMKAGAATYIHNMDSVTDVTSFYGQFNMALNRYVMNLNTRYNTFDGAKYGKLTSALSMGVKVGNGAVLHAGLGISGFVMGSRPESMCRFDALSYNFGVEGGSAKSAVNGSADFYIHHNTEQYEYFFFNNLTKKEESTFKTMSVNNVGGDFRVNAKLIDTKTVKWRFGGNVAINACFIVDADDYGNSAKSTVETIDWGPDEKPMTFKVLDPVFDNSGNQLHNVYVDYKNDSTITSSDLMSSECSAIPMVSGGVYTYFEVMGAYLQVNAHGSADKFNAYDKNGSNILTTSDIHNSSFMRIDNIVLGYKFSNLWLMSGRAYFAVQNPYVFTKYEGRDPEIHNGFDSYGIEQRPTIFSVGVKLNINLKD